MLVFLLMYINCSRQGSAKRKEIDEDWTATKEEQAAINKKARAMTKQIIGDVHRSVAAKNEARRKAKIELEKKQAAAEREVLKRLEAAEEEQRKNNTAAAREEDKRIFAEARAEEQETARLEIAYARRMAAEAEEEKQRLAAVGQKRQPERRPPPKKTTKKSSMFDVFR